MQLVETKGVMSGWAEVPAGVVSPLCILQSEASLPLNEGGGDVAAHGPWQPTA